MPFKSVLIDSPDLLKQHACTCIDGRSESSRYSAAGGTLGLIVHLLHSHDEFILSQTQIRHYLQTVAETVTPLYFHSDQKTIERIYSKLNKTMFHGDIIHDIHQSSNKVLHTHLWKYEM